MILKNYKTSYGKVTIFVMGKNEISETSSLNPEETRICANNFFNIPLENIYLLKQVHGDKSWNTSEIESGSLPEGDALYSAKEKEILIIKTADCMPLFFWSESRPLIGAVHSGWKGALSGISEKLFLKLNENSGYSETFGGYLGPCIRMKSYEVSLDLAERFGNEYPECINFLNGKYYLGLDSFLKFRMKKNDIKINIDDCEICAKENSAFYSHRAKDSGRNLNGIYMERNI